MSHLLLEKDLRSAKEGSVVRSLARARTFAVMQRLNAERNKTVARVLGESKLIETDGTTVSLLKGASFDHADLAGVDLTGADLSGADLRKATLDHAKLDRANLEGADLTGANMQLASFDHADMHNVYAFRVNLELAHLWGTNFGPDTYLSGANLRHANLDSANLSGTYLEFANLSGASHVTQEQLVSCAELGGATMPDGQTLSDPKMHNGPTLEEWLKEKGARKVLEDGNNN
jgi:uncharacterized protein YjbI with pentapeptide repeats